MSLAVKQEHELKLRELEAAMLQCPQVDCPVSHHFGGGIYLREMFAPAGTLLLGHEHTTDHMCILLKGSMKILADSGEVSTIKAPMIFSAKSGRKFALTLEDVIFMNLHPTEETDIEKIEAKFIKKSDVWSQKHLEDIKKLQGEL